MIRATEKEQSNICIIVNAIVGFSVDFLIDFLQICLDTLKEVRDRAMRIQEESQSRQKE